MPADSQAVTRLQEDRLAAVARLEDIETRLTAANEAAARYTASKATVEDEIADIDEAIAAAIALP